MRSLAIVLVLFVVLFVVPQAQAGDCFAGNSGGVFFSTGFRAFDPVPDVFVARSFGVSRSFFVPQPSFGFSRGFGVNFAVGVGRGPVVIQERRGLFGLRRTTTIIGR